MAKHAVFAAGTAMSGSPRSQAGPSMPQVTMAAADQELGMGGISGEGRHML